MEYCCHVCEVAPSCYFDMLNKLQKRIFGTVGHKLAACSEPLTHRQNVARLSLFRRITLVLHLNGLNWFHFLILMTGLLRIPIGCMIFFSLFLDAIRMSLLIVSFLPQLDFGIFCLQNAFLCTMI